MGASMKRLSTVMLVVVVGLTGLVPAAAQEGNGKYRPLTWADAPIVPRHRSEADWLVDAGWQSPAEVYGPFPTHEYQVGETERFIPLGGYYGETVPFVLANRSPNAYYWFERGYRPSPADLEETARFFEEHIFPLNHDIYGDEWNPGIDGDSRIHIVGQSSIGMGVLGAFNPDDQCPQSLCDDSNQREIIYIGLDLAPLGSPEFLTTLAHEHQHLIQYHVDGNEQRWFNEGLSQLAEHLNGFHPRYVGSYNMIDYLDNTDLSLNGWSNGYDMGSYYGSAYLFMVYLYEQFGLEFIRALAASDYDGLASVENVLEGTGQSRGLDQVFGDWIVANLLDDPYVDDGRYYYQGLDLPNSIEPVPVPFRDGGAVYSDSVSQYGADYLSIDQPGSYRLSFDGSDETHVVETRPHSADRMWWSYNGDSSAARLTAAFDLAGLDTITLSFSAWWNVEEGYDWFHVLISEDGGQNWVVLGGSQASPESGFTPGAYYSGQSERWIDEQIDLSAYAGKQVQVRFEYLTDSALTFPGVALDDIGIVELGPLDDVELDSSPWSAEGFIRIPASAPQHWAVAVIVRPAEGPAQVIPLALDDLNTGRADFTVPDGGSATVAIGAMAPFSTSRASYKLAVQG